MKPPKNNPRYQPKPADKKGSRPPAQARPRLQSTSSNPSQASSSWENASGWYNKAVGSEGHYYHTHVVLPGLLKLLAQECPTSPSLLDLACGQGILTRHIPKHFSYTGVDISPSLVQAAKNYKTDKSHQFVVADVTGPLNIEKKDFTHVTLVLALQNIAHPLKAFQTAQRHLQKGGKFLIVLNHPYFRIPRQTAWQVDHEKKIQYRRVDRYLSPLEIPIYTNPGQQAKDPSRSQDPSSYTLSFHHPLSAYSAWLKEAGFVLELIEEWCSDKTSTGSAAAMENRARKEFPLFMTLVARRL